jgi:AraC-like DNA-binding protein
VKTGQRIRRVPFVAPTPFGVEVLTLGRLWAIAPPAYLATPQRPAFHILISATASAVTHTVDFRPYQLSLGQSLWVRPGQVQLFGEARPAGGLVLFQPDFLIPNTQAAKIADDRFGPMVFNHAPAVGRARRALRTEYAVAASASQATVVQTETLRHLLSVLILTLSRDVLDPAPSDPGDLYGAFRDLLERDFAIAHDVAHYADSLGYSSRTLARAVHAASGQTPKQAIQSRLTLEARRLLAHTNLPISTVATQLGFRDASNFATFFVRQSGQTPTAFRDQQRPRTAALRPAGPT